MPRRVILRMAINLTVDERAAAMKAASSELRFLLDKEEISEDLQAKLYHIGITTLARFAAMASGVPDLRDFLRDSLALDTAAGLPARLAVTKFIVAFTTASTRVEKRLEVEAEREARRITRHVPTTVMSAMRSAYEAQFGRLDDRDVPGKGLIEKLLEGVETGEIQSTMLSAVANLEEDAVETMVPVWGTTGNLQVQKSSNRVKLPETPEQLRYRLTLLGTAWQFIATKNTNQEFLKDLFPSLWQDYLHYLLGPHVYGLTAKGAQGQVVATPPWALILQYDQEIRRLAMKRVREGASSLMDALPYAWRDSVCKERNFATPLALSTSVGRQDPPGERHEQGDKRDSRGDKSPKGKSGGKKGDKGTGKGKKNKPQCASASPSGAKICFRFNTGKCKSGKKCTFEHICGVCFSTSHNMLSSDCKQRISGETQGSG